MVEFVKFFFRCLDLVILIRLGQLIADVPKSEIADQRDAFGSLSDGLIYAATNGTIRSGYYNAAASSFFSVLKSSTVKKCGIKMEIECRWIYLQHF